MDMSESDVLPDLPWVMAKLRDLLDDYARARTEEPDNWHVVVEATYRHRVTGEGITLLVGTEPASHDDYDA
jgi:hypothetical protein